MTLFPISLTNGSSPSTLTTDQARRAPDREKEPLNKAWAPPGDCCLRCGGLFHTYAAFLEEDGTGAPVPLWRCVNCGDCEDRNILVNR